MFLPGYIGAPGGLELIELSNSSTVSNYNLFTQAGSPAGAVHVVFTNTGILFSTSTAAAALTVSGFAAGSQIEIVNSGNIRGAGGDGGDGGDGNDDGDNGGAGGNAISLGNDVTINNSTGNIFGGGGGGGGGGGQNSLNGSRGGSGGGGGQGHNGGVGGIGGNGSDTDGDDGTAGSPTAAGEGETTNGNGGDGGAWGTAGSPGQDVSGDGGNGGAAGKAIALNGHTATFTAGNNSTQVKGAVS